ncbi:MAG: hypothetical protein ACRD35_05800 [Candidatus Acidiferrales bacterium]
MRRAVIFILVALTLLSLAPGLAAQGCAMCRAAAAGTDETGRKSFDLAILFLLLPAGSMFIGVLLWAFRNRNRTWSPPEPENRDAVPLLPEIDEASFWRSFNR